MKHYNIILCGVGGTGVVGFGDVLKQAGANEGMDVLGNEQKGRSQRGGGVTNTVRLTMLEEGEKADARNQITGAIPWGAAHLLVATEAAEALRNTVYLNKHSEVVVNTFELRPVGIEYPDINKGIAWLKEIAGKVLTVNASQVSMEKYGSYRMTNPILLGVVVARTGLPLKKEALLGLLSEQEKQAFEIGLGMECR